MLLKRAKPLAFFAQNYGLTNSFTQIENSLGLKDS